MKKEIKLFIEHDGKQYDLDKGEIIWGERIGLVTPEEKYALECAAETIVKRFQNGELTEKDVKKAQQGIFEE